MAGDATIYTGLITSQHADKPKFVATVAASCQPFADMTALCASMAALFDVDVAVGQQLDVVGQWVGATRYLQAPLTGIYFAWDTAGVGWDQGTWQGTFDPSSGQVMLADDAFRTLIKARIADNAWDGSVSKAVSLLSPVFPGDYPFIQDRGDLQIFVGLTGPTPLNAVLKQLFLSGLLNVKPAGVTVNYALPSIDGAPIFGLDVNNAIIGGLDSGAFASIT